MPSKAKRDLASSMHAQVRPKRGQGKVKPGQTRPSVVKGDLASSIGALARASETMRALLSARRASAYLLARASELYAHSSEGKKGQTRPCELHASTKPSEALRLLCASFK